MPPSSSVRRPTTTSRPSRYAVGKPSLDAPIALLSGGLAGAEAILKLRALISNGDLDAYWSFHLVQKHQRVHHRHEYQLTA